MGVTNSETAGAAYDTQRWCTRQVISKTRRAEAVGTTRETGPADYRCRSYSSGFFPRGKLDRVEGYAAPSEAQGVGQEGRTRDLRPRGGFSSVQQVKPTAVPCAASPSPCRKIQLPHRLQKTEDQRFPGQEKEDRGAALGKNKSAQVPAWCDGGKPDQCAISPKIWYNMIVERIYPLSRQDLPLPVSAVPDPGFLLRHQGGFHFRLDLQGIRKDREGAAGQGHLKCLPLPRVHAQALFPSPGETLSGIGLTCFRKGTPPCPRASPRSVADR